MIVVDLTKTDYPNILLRLTPGKPVYLVTPNNTDPKRYYYLYEKRKKLKEITHLKCLSDQSLKPFSHFYNQPFYIACNGNISSEFRINFKEFMVCSYGGCGSTLLHEALQKYGVSHHVHSRCPPEKLEHISGEHFNGIQIHPDQLHRFKVIYIYRDPTAAILSWDRRFKTHKYFVHLEHIESPHAMNLEQMVSTSEDMYGIQEFYRNYTTCASRNYNICCVKYENLFKHQDQLSEWLGIGPLNLTMVEHKHESIHTGKLEDIYSDLSSQMKKNDPLFII
jgi:hypothetical protein